MASCLKTIIDLSRIVTGCYLLSVMLIRTTAYCTLASHKFQTTRCSLWYSIEFTLLWLEEGCWCDFDRIHGQALLLELGLSSKFGSYWWLQRSLYHRCKEEGALHIKCLCNPVVLCVATPVWSSLVPVIGALTGNVGVGISMACCPPKWGYQTVLLVGWASKN